MQIHRLFEMVYLLLNKKRMTTKELAEHFEVSRRTVLRDIDTLSQAGVPIYTAPGKGGGVSILDHFVLDKTAISDEEQNQILFALQSIGASGNLEAADILARLQALFDKTDTNWIEVDLSRWGNSGPDREKFECLKRAVIGRHAVSFLYSSSYGETTQRTVYPLKLVFKSKAWYLQAYCLQKKDYRTFKLNRIRTIEVLEHSYQEIQLSPPPIETAEPPPGELVHLSLVFSAQVAYRVFDEFDAGEIAHNPDGTFTVSVDMPDDCWLYSFLLSYGTAVQVLTPRHVKEKLAGEVEKLRNFLSHS